MLDMVVSMCSMSVLGASSRKKTLGEMLDMVVSMCSMSVLGGFI